jgi:NAD(P)-dependent dehydrogenase (short-subunit alcohol dehydrogenase family)
MSIKKKLIVTGGSQGLDLTIVETFLAQSADVVAIDDAEFWKPKFRMLAGLLQRRRPADLRRTVTGRREPPGAESRRSDGSRPTRRIMIQEDISEHYLWTIRRGVSQADGVPPSADGAKSVAYCVRSARPSANNLAIPMSKFVRLPRQ